nr:hypothetical protein CQNTEFLM_CQNTEFLM_CDS_0009 [uncultured phage]
MFRGFLLYSPALSRCPYIDLIYIRQMETFFPSY